MVALVKTLAENESENENGIVAIRADEHDRDPGLGAVPIPTKKRTGHEAELETATKNVSEVADPRVPVLRPVVLPPRNREVNRIWQQSLWLH